MAGAFIRDMAKRDLPRVMEIERASFPTPWTVQMFRQQLLIGDIAVNLVTEAVGKVVGYAVSWLAFDEIHLLSIAVAPSERRRGYAGGLLDEVIRRGVKMGASTVILEVRMGNTAAQEFYAGHGFTVIGTRRRYYADTGEDAIVMERDIEI
ncbi:MAG TPA: ribosomal protein S18-alanine N-acetyltransferase [Patescibacteria group bacterium]|nr:ribosomal protein S18-alanine N-acetyltransferase [Patescibacteria group bacterium]